MQHDRNARLFANSRCCLTLEELVMEGDCSDDRDCDWYQ